MTTIKEEWMLYASYMVPKDACEAQVQETRRAFYAGFGTAIGNTVRLAMTGDEDALGELLERFMSEFIQFQKDVSEGKK